MGDREDEHQIKEQLQIRDLLLGLIVIPQHMEYPLHPVDRLEYNGTVTTGRPAHAGSTKATAHRAPRCE